MVTLYPASARNRALVRPVTPALDIGLTLAITNERGSHNNSSPENDDAFVGCHYVSKDAVIDVMY